MNNNQTVSDFIGLKNTTNSLKICGSDNIEISTDCDNNKTDFDKSPGFIYNVSSKENLTKVNDDFYKIDEHIVIEESLTDEEIINADLDKEQIKLKDVENTVQEPISIDDETKDTKKINLDLDVEIIKFERVKKIVDDSILNNDETKGDKVINIDVEVGKIKFGDVETTPQTQILVDDKTEDDKKINAGLDLEKTGASGEKLSIESDEVNVSTVVTKTVDSGISTNYPNSYLSDKTIHETVKKMAAVKFTDCDLIIDQDFNIYQDRKDSTLAYFECQLCPKIVQYKFRFSKYGTINFRNILVHLKYHFVESKAGVLDRGRKRKYPLNPDPEHLNLSTNSLCDDLIIPDNCVLATTEIHEQVVEIANQKFRQCQLKIKDDFDLYKSTTDVCSGYFACKICARSSLDRYNYKVRFSPYGTLVFSNIQTHLQYHFQLSDNHKRKRGRKPNDSDVLPITNPSEHEISFEDLKSRMSIE